MSVAETVVAEATLDAKGSLRSRVLSAGAWSLASYAGSQVIRLGSSMVMTRLLMPEAYGLYTLVSTYMVGIVMFSDVGLGAYLFQSKRAHDQVFADSIWTLAVTRGVIVWCVGLALAWPMSHFYNQPVLLPMLAVGSLGLLLNTLQSTKLTLASRDLKQKELVVFGITNQVVAIAIQLALAWWFRSVWALVIGGLLSEMIRVMGSQFLFPGQRNHWCWDPALVKELRSFSTWVYLSSIMFFVGGQADRLILGKIMPMEFLGVYGIAMTFATLPLALVQQGSGLISPVVVQLRHRNDSAIQQKLQEARGLLLRVGAILVALMCVTAPAFYGFLYDRRYAGAATIAALLAVNIWSTVLQVSASSIPLAFGDSRSTAYMSASRMLGTVVGMLVGYRLGGVYGLVVGAAGGDIAMYVTSVIAARRHRIHLDWAISSTLFLIGLIAIGSGVSWVLSRYVLSPRCSSVAGGAALLLAVLLVERTQLVWLFDAIRKRFTIET